MSSRAAYCCFMGVFAALVCPGRAWSQSGYPDGSPFSPGTASPGVQVGTSDFLGVNGSGTTAGDTREGWGGVAGIGAYVAAAPYNSSDYGGIRFRMYYDADFDGHPSPLSGWMVNDVSVVTRWNNYPEFGGWRWAPADGFNITPYATFLAKGLPPGIYSVYADGRASHGGDVAFGGFYGWYCPDLKKVRVRVLKPDGSPAPNLLIQPVAKVEGFWHMGIYPKSWRAGYTNAQGLVELVIPDGCANTFDVPGAAGVWQGGVALNPVQAEGPMFNSGMPASLRLNIVLSANGAPAINPDTTPDPTPSPSPSPDPGGSGTSSPDFWSALWVPDPAKMEQLQGQKDYWGAWGPFGLVGGIMGIWNTAALAQSDEHKWDGLIWRINGPLGDSYIDFRPELAAGAADYPTGGRGGVAGTILAYGRVGAGLLVWCATLFGLYRKLRPVIVS